MSQELFSPGQTVTWDASDDAFMMRHFTTDYGPGPFKVLEVFNIPEDECSCGGSLDDETHQIWNGCPYASSGCGPLRKSVGHPQWVIIDNGTGKPFTYTLLGVDLVSRFSGSWFKAA